MPLYFVSFRAILSPALVRGSRCRRMPTWRRSCPPSTCGPFALASVTSSIVPNVIRTYPPSRPARFGLNADVAHAACNWGYYLRCCSFLASMRRIFMCDRYFFHILFAYIRNSSYLCSRKGLTQFYYNPYEKNSYTLDCIHGERNLHAS